MQYDLVWELFFVKLILQSLSGIEYNKTIEEEESMHYKIQYSCLSHIGNIRKMNQDNFICDGRYMSVNDVPMKFPLCGTKTSKDKSVFGVFDGLGGEECGEIASYIASKTASEIEIGRDAAADLSRF